MVYKYNPSSAKKIPKDLQHQRAKLMYQYRYKEGKEGMTLGRIGRIFGVTRERARQIIEDFERKLKQMELGLDKQK